MQRPCGKRELGDSKDELEEGQFKIENKGLRQSQITE